jgi:hypothetical protein
MELLTSLRVTASLKYGLARVALFLLSACAFYATWGRSLIDGTLNRMLDIRSANVPFIPSLTSNHEPGMPSVASPTEEHTCSMDHRGPASLA